MPDFTDIQSRLDSVNRATMVLEQLRSIYNQCLLAGASLDLYTAETDPVFNDAVDRIFSLTERQELQQMLIQIDALVTNWQANHGILLGV